MFSVLKAMCLPVLALLITTTYSQQGNLAGRVVSASGNVAAKEEGVANSRQVIRRSEIFAGDTLSTGEDSHAQFRMSDAAIISLGCNSRLKIEDYWYQEGPNDQVTLRLLSGRFRTITGAVGQQFQHRYRFLVGESEVEVAGTDFEVKIEENGNIYFGNYDGGITVANPLGSLQLGIGGKVDFAVVEPDSAPEGMSIQPPQIGSVGLVANSTAQLSGNCF